MESIENNWLLTFTKGLLILEMYKYLYENVGVKMFLCNVYSDWKASENIQNVLDM